MPATQVHIQGSGIVAHVAALALAQSGLRVALSPQRPAPSHGDVRAYAINAASRALLESIRIWQMLTPQAICAVHAMRIQAESTPAIDFDTPPGRTALAWIVDVPELESTLRDAMRYVNRIHTLQPEESCDAELTLICEGRTSARRSDLGVQFDVTPYGHTAIAARIHTQHPHRHTAHQWFGQPGRGDVLGLLPLSAADGHGQSGHCAALVWSLGHARAERFLQMDAPSFENELTQTTQNLLGSMRLCSQRMSWPLQAAVARRVTGPGWILLGDAAHNMHPLAGQGLNLGLGDVRALLAVLNDKESFRGIGDARLLRRYERARSLDVSVMTAGNDGLYRVFGHPDARIATLRRWGLNLFNASQPLKSWTIRQAMGI